MADVSTITASNGTTYNIKDVTARGLLPSSPIRIYTSLTGTAAVTSSPYYCARYDVTDSSVTEYTNGMMVSIRVPVAGNGNYGTALQINSLGYKPIVYNVSDMISTRYSVGSQIIAVYNSTQTATLYLNSSSATTITGCWQVCDYNANDPNYAARTYYGTPKLSSASAYTLYRMQIVLPLLDGTYVPYSNGNNQPTTYTKTINTTNAFNPFGIIYFFNYTSTSTVAAGGNIFDAYLNYQYSNPFDLRYAMNINSSGTAGTTALTAHQPVYIKAKYNYNTHTAVLVPNASSSNYLEKSSIVQTLPSSNPDTALTADETYIYIYIGHTHDKYRIGGVYQKTVYNWDAVNNCIQVFDGNRPEAVVFVSQSSTFSQIFDIKQKGKIPIYKDADGFAFPEQIEDSSPNEFIFTKATDTGTIKWYKVDSVDTWTTGTTSGGSSVSDLFWCTYESTTYAEVTQAIEDGKLPVCSYNGFVYVFAGSSSGTYMFQGYTRNDSPANSYRLQLTSAGVWGTANVSLSGATWLLRTNNQTLPMKSVTYRYRLLFTSADNNYFVPANNSTSTNATASRNPCQDAINPFGPIFLYYNTTSVSAGSKPGATSLYQQYNKLSFGYSFAAGSALTMTISKPVFLKCSPQNDGSAKIYNNTKPWVQDLPTSDDGYIYIFLGVASSATEIDLFVYHPVYYHDGSKIALWTGSSASHSTTYYAQNQSISNGNNVTVTAPSYYAYGQYFVDITGYIYSTQRTTRVYLKPTNSSMDIFYGEIVDCDLEGGLYDQFFVILEKVSSTSYTYRCVESGQENSFLDLMKKATTYRSNSGHTLTNFGVIT